MVLRALADGGSLDEDEAYDQIGPPSYLAGTPDDDVDDDDLAQPMDPAADLATARSAVSNLNRSTESTRKALLEARQRLLASKYDKTAALLAIAQGLTRPTQQGGFAGFTESLGNMAGALQKPVSDKRDFERQKMQDMLGIDESMYGLDQKTAESAIKLAQIRARLTQMSKAPAALQVWEAYQKMNPEERVQFLETMRNPNVTYKENEGVVTRLDPRAATHPGVPGIVEKTPMTTLDKEAAAQQAIAEAKEAGKTTGEKVATAQFNLPEALSGADYLKTLIGKLRDHKGMPFAVGATSLLPVVPGSNAADFTAMLEQVGGKQFLQAYESLRGTGQITEIEGKKASDAIARMQTAQSEKAFREAADEFTGIVERAVTNLRTKARATASPAAALPRIASDAEYAALKSGQEFIDPNGKKRRKP